ncbi:MAG TPA: XylR family transcriptional regulator, partial [Verrucomicrobiae bacterium]|nr:XylR family transcriptional regulator [Verrucomicrobiae bacterium]
MKKFLTPPNRPQVALLVESSRAYGRGALLGISRYIREYGPWSIFFQELSFSAEMPPWLKNWRGQGIISRMENRELNDVIRQLKIPAVFLRNTESNMKLPSVLTDNAASARVAFEHLQERGFRHFGFCGYNGADYSDERRESFVDSVARAGLRCHVFEGVRKGHRSSTVKYEEEGLKDGDLVERWISALPRPIGLMACNDMRGQQVLNACRSAGVAVPDEVAVIGVDNEELLCDLSDPPLSSVVPNT